MCKINVNTDYVEHLHPNPACATNSSGQCCLGCGPATAAGAKFCPQCGQSLTAFVDERSTISSLPTLPTADAKPDPRTPTIGPDTQPQTDAYRSQVLEPPATVAVCDCGRELPENAQFCPRCGKPVACPVEESYCLVLRIPGQKATYIPLVGDQLTVGKSPDNDLVIPGDDYVSRQHAQILKKDKKILLEDLGSSNGTLLKIRRMIELEVGDEILVGTNMLTLQKSVNPTIEPEVWQCLR